MKILFKYTDQSKVRSQINLDLDLSMMVREVRQRISRILDLPVPCFHLFIKQMNLTVLMTDTWPLGFYTDDLNPKIKIKLLECSLFFRRDSMLVSSSGSLFALVPIDSAIFACRNNDLIGLKIILDNEEEDLVHQCQDCQWGLIHYACLEGNHEILKFLLEKSVNCNKVTIDEWTPLQIACYFNKIECVKLLIASQSLHVNKKTKFRGTALHIACERNYIEIIRLILLRNPVVSIEDFRKKTAIEYAKCMEVVEMLAIFAGECEVKKAIEQGELLSPFCSDVFAVYVFSLSDKPSFLYMDIERQTLSRYANKAAFLDKCAEIQMIRLIDVQNISCELNKKGNHYFTIETAKTTYKYFTRFEELTKEWVVRIKQVVEYCIINHKDAAIKGISERVEQSIEDDSTMDSNSHFEAADDMNISQFTIIEEIGNGSFGTVYRVRKNGCEEEFAMKSMSVLALKKQKQLKYAISECKIMKQLNHPFIVKLFFTFQTPKYLYFVLQLCRNGDLLNHLQKCKKISENLAKFYIAEVILALEYLHSNGIIYRDLKPANILLDDDYHIRLADFGLAKEKVNVINPAMTLAGSPAYLAPEIISKKGATAASDIYGLGPLFYELLTGETPYYHEDLDVLFENIRSSKLILPQGISPQAGEFISMVMNKDPSKRPIISQIKRLSLFRKFDWEAILAKRIKPPIVVI